MIFFFALACKYSIFYIIEISNPPLIIPLLSTYLILPNVSTPHPPPSPSRFIWDSRAQQNQFDWKSSSEFSYIVMLREYIWHAKCKRETGELRADSGDGHKWEKREMIMIFRYPSEPNKE